MFVKKGDYSVVPDKSGKNERKNGKPGSGGEVIFSDKPEKMDDIPKVGDEKPGIKTFRDFDSDKKSTSSKAKEVKPDKPSKVFKGNLPKKNWQDITNQAMSRNSVSDKARKLIRSLKTSEPLVDWKKELKKFFDNTFKSDEWVLPNKRFLAGGDMLYGRKNIGDDTLKTIVAAVDTSGSISREQIKTFINEIMYLTKTFDADRTIIIYCSDSIDNVDIVKKGGVPDLTKIASTGGNEEGFIPPFQWVEKNKIKPSAFIYLTDTGGEMPDPNKYGINKYRKKVLWFICSPEMYNPPSFGKILFAPVASIKSTK
jgi:predicted metal-dependent peptidase